MKNTATNANTSNMRASAAVVPHALEASEDFPRTLHAIVFGKIIVVRIVLTLHFNGAVAFVYERERVQEFF